MQAMIVYRKNTAYINTAHGLLTLGEMLEVMLKARHRTMHSACKAVGISHATGYHLLDGTNNSIKAFIQLAKELGYEAVVEDTFA